MPRTRAGLEERIHQARAPLAVVVLAVHLGPALPVGAGQTAALPAERAGAALTADQLAAFPLSMTAPRAAMDLVGLAVVPVVLRLDPPLMVSPVRLERELVVVAVLRREQPQASAALARLIIYGRKRAIRPLPDLAAAVVAARLLQAL